MESYNPDLINIEYIISNKCLTLKEKSMENL